MGNCSSSRAYHGLPTCTRADGVYEPVYDPKGAQAAVLARAKALIVLSTHAALEAMMLQKEYRDQMRLRARAERTTLKRALLLLQRRCAHANKVVPSG